MAADPLVPECPYCNAQDILAPDALTPGLISVLCPYCGNDVVLRESLPVIPWEEEERGILSSLFATLALVFSSPARLFQGVTMSGTVFSPLMYTLFCSLFTECLWNLITPLYAHHATGVFPDEFFTLWKIWGAGIALLAVTDYFRIGTYIFGILFILAGIVVFAATMPSPLHILGLLLGIFIVICALQAWVWLYNGALWLIARRKADFLATLKLLAYASSGQIFIPLPHAGPYLAYTFTGILTAIGLRNTYRVSWTSAVIITLIAILAHLLVLLALLAAYVYMPREMMP